MAGGGKPETDDVFVEETPHERGFTDIFAADVAPHLPSLRRRLRNRQSDRVAVRRILGVVLLIAIWTVYAVWGEGMFDLLATAAVSGLTLDLFLRGRVFDDNDPVREMGGLIATAVKRHVEGLDCKPFVGRRINDDRFVDYGLLPEGQNLTTGAFFTGECQGRKFRAVVCTLRQAAERTVFHGLLIEIDTDTALEAPVVVLRRDQSDLSPTDMPEVELSGHPAFRAMFAVYSDDFDTVRGFLTEPVMTAMTRLPEQSGDGVISAAAHAGQLLLAVRLAPARPQEATKLDAVAEAREQLRTVTLPYRLIDTLHGIDPDTGGRYRAR